MRGQVLQQYLNSQADRIEAVLRENDLLARVDGGLVGPRLVVFRLRVAGHAANLLDRLRKLEETLALRLDQSQVQIRRDGGRLLLLVPLPGRPRPVWLEAYRKFLRPNTMLLGVRADAPDHPLLICPAHPDVAHILVTGSTGSGKTVLLKTMILSLASATSPERARLILIDPKGGQFAGLERLPQLAEMVRGRSQAVASILAELAAEMEQRDQSGQREPRIYVFIDELADALALGQAEVAAPLTRLAQRGRGSGLHLVAGTQKPTAEAIGGLIKFNFRARIVGAVPSSSDAVVASGVRQSGAERLLGQGDFMIFGPARLRFQAARVRHEPDLIERLAAAASPQRQWVYEAEEPASPVRKLLQFPLNRKKQRGGHNRKPFSPEQIADAQTGLNQGQLRLKYGLSGSRAARLVRDYGPERKAL